MPDADRSDEEMLGRLEDIYASTGGGASIDIAAMTIVEALDEIGADAAFVGVLDVDGQTIQVARVTPYSRSPVRLAFPVGAPYPIAETLRSKQPLFVASNEQLRCDHPGLVRVKDEDHACATIPLFSEEGELLGALNLGFEDPHEFSQHEQSLIADIAARCARLLSR
jgi:GAF domain-containing protein